LSEGQILDVSEKRVIFQEHFFGHNMKILMNHTKQVKKQFPHREGN